MEPREAAIQYYEQIGSTKEPAEMVDGLLEAIDFATLQAQLREKDAEIKALSWSGAQTDRVAALASELAASQREVERLKKFLLTIEDDWKATSGSPVDVIIAVVNMLKNKYDAASEERDRFQAENTVLKVENGHLTTQIRCQAESSAQSIRENNTTFKWLREENDRLQAENAALKTHVEQLSDNADRGFEKWAEYQNKCGELQAENAALKERNVTLEARCYSMLGHIPGSVLCGELRIAATEMESKMAEVSTLQAELDAAIELLKRWLNWGCPSKETLDFLTPHKEATNAKP